MRPDEIRKPRFVERQILGVTILTVYGLELLIAWAIVVYFFFTATRAGRILLRLAFALVVLYFLEQPAAYFLGHYGFLVHR